MATLLLQIEYDGTNYGGWQKQPNAPTIQQEIETAIEILTGKNYSVIGAGRTDAGVHARGQVAHIFFEEKFPLPEEKILKAINSRLPQDIRIRETKILSDRVHARFDAVAREYSYTIARTKSVFERNFTSHIPQPFDEDILFDAAKIFSGEHDFTTFSKYNPETKHYRCNVHICEWLKISEGKYRLQIRADRFVYGMVRSLTGAMLDAAKGKRSIVELQQALEEKDRAVQSPLAPPEGLILEKIFFKEEFFQHNR